MVSDETKDNSGISEPSFGSSSLSMLGRCSVFCRTTVIFRQLAGIQVIYWVTMIVTLVVQTRSGYILGCYCSGWHDEPCKLVGGYSETQTDVDCVIPGQRIT